MGIDRQRFDNNVELEIEKFLCGICKDVASDPVLTKPCEHYMCLECFNPAKKICLTCGSTIDHYIELGIALQRIYLDINIRCVNDRCNEILTIGNYIEHERKCPYGLKAKILALDDLNEQLKTVNDHKKRRGK